jgi:outer membrane lipoprotein-sorting protein
MKSLNLLIATLLITGMITGQTDQKAKDILDKVSAKNKQYKTAKADFIYSLDNDNEDIHEKTQGVIWIKGDKYKLNLMGNTIFFNGDTVWTLNKKAKEVNITLPDNNQEGSLDPSKVFTMYETGFTYSFVSERFEKGLQLYDIDLFPIDKEKPYSKIKLKIDKNKLHIYSVEYFGNDNNIYKLEIMRFTPDLPMDDKIFYFNINENPDVDVIDMT